MYDFVVNDHIINSIENKVWGIKFSAGFYFRPMRNEKCGYRWRGDKGDSHRVAESDCSIWLGHLLEGTVGIYV